MRRAIIALFVALATVALWVAPASAQNLRNRVAPICTDVSNTNSAQEEGFIDCDWLKSGTALATPFYIVVKSWNSNLSLEVDRLDDIVSNNVQSTARTVLVTSAIVGLNTATGEGELVEIDSGSGALKVSTSGGGVATVAVDDDSTTTCVAITDTSTRYTLPVSGDSYTVCANANNAYLLCGASGVPVATTAVNGHFIQIGSGVCVALTLTGPDCAVIGASTNGQICFVHHVS